MNCSRARVLKRPRRGQGHHWLLKFSQYQWSKGKTVITIKHKTTEAILYHSVEETLDYAMLPGAAWAGANLQGVSLIGADLRGADLQGALLNAVDLSFADLAGALLSVV